jgi:uncharacterized membrane protein YgcG
MILSLRRNLLASLVLALLAGSLLAAEAPAVRDEAGFFTPAAARQADDDLAAIKKLFDVDVRIETVKSVPTTRVTEVKEMNPTQRSQFFAQWAQERMAATNVDGIYVLICKAPGHLQVEVGQKTEKKTFTKEDAVALRSALLTPFRAKEYDEGLRAGVNLVRDRLNKNVPPTQRLVARREVKDYAGLFSAAAVQKAIAVLQGLPRQPGKDVALETFAAPPQPQKLEGMSPAQRNKYFKDWTENRATRSNLEGVLVLICKQPGHFHIDVRGKPAQQLLARADVEKLDRELASRLGAREFDRGLLDTVELLRAKLQPGAVAAAPAPVIPQAPARPAPLPAVKPSPLATAPPKSAPDAAPPPIKASADGKVAQAPRSPADTAEKKDIWDLKRAKEKAEEVAHTKVELWIVVVAVVGGLLALWILVGILRALFGRRQPPPVTAAPRPAAPAPSAAPNYPHPGPSYPPAAPGVPVGRPPQTAGYGYGQGPSSYPAAVPPAPVQPGGGGGGFVGNVLGGMFGAAAGSWIYDSLRRGGGPAPGGPMHTPPAAPYRPAAPQPTSYPQNAPNDDAYSRGGDFDTTSPGGDATARGGDFDASPESTADIGGGGEFGQQAQGDLGGGGEFGSPQTADLGGGGDFGSAPAADAGGGADFGSAQTADAGGGGDFASEPPAEPEPYADAGGDFDAGGSSDSPAVADQGGSGGDFGSDDVASNKDQGGDFG